VGSGAARPAARNRLGMLYLAKAVRECEIKVSLFVALPNEI
jgi:hypothetical protein